MGRHRRRADRLGDRRLSGRRSRRARHRREPADGDALLLQAASARGRLGHPVLHDRLHLRRTGGGGRLPCGLFNIGGEGQATVAGLGVALVLNNLDLPAGIPADPPRHPRAAAFGAAWAAVPGYLQAKRGSHIVITTIMFNWLASVLIVYLLVNVLREPHSMNPETRAFPEQSHIPFMHEALGALRHRDPGIAAQPHASCWRWRRLRDLASHLPLAPRLCHPRRRREPDRRSMRASRPRASSSSRWSSPAPWRAASRSTSSWATSTACCSNSRRLRLRRHRGRAHGSSASGRHHPRVAPVRHALPGRRRARLRAAGHHPRHGGGDRRHHHPVRRGARRLWRLIARA